MIRSIRLPYSVFVPTCLQKTLFPVLILCFLFLPINSAFAQLNLDRLSQQDILKVKNLLNQLEPLIDHRTKEASLATLTFKELYAPLTKDEAEFLKSFQGLDAKTLNVKIPFRGMATGEEPLFKIAGQKIRCVKVENGELRDLPIQYLPQEVYEKNEEMMQAMQKDIGKRFYIESGYRSSAYQLYLFVYYLKNHDYSIRETTKFVALPGYSEHGAPAHQAVDYINEMGINGEENIKEFEDLPEYQWLLKNAHRFGFVLSYPKTDKSGITYEPWHWRFDSSP